MSTSDENARRLSLALMAAKCGLWDWDIRENVFYFDPNYFLIAGYEPDAFPHNFDEWAKRVHQDDLARAENTIQKYVSGEIEAFSVDFRFKTQSGEWMWIRGKGEITEWDDEGKPRRFTGLHIDITEQKRAEEALCESEEKISSILHSAPIGIGQVTNRVFNYVNEQFAQMLGYTVSELVGKTSRILYPSDEEFERVGRYKYQEIKEKGTCSIETIMQKKDGALLDVILSSTPLDQSDWSKGVTFSVLDITERKEEEKRRLELEGQLRQKHKIEAIGVMAGGMAHNFNNNLSVILGNLELIQLKQPPNPAIKKRLEDAHTAALRSRDLIKKIMLSSRQDAPEKKPLKLAPFIAETFKLLRSTVPTSVAIEQHIEARDISVLADATQIQECLINLCNNAMQAMDEKGTITIILDREELGPKDIPQAYAEAQPGIYAKLSVTDTGCGMPPEVAEKIFDLFFTTKPAYEGSGVGLSTVYGIIKKHAGLIKVQSQEGKGSTFDLYLPLMEQEEALSDDDMSKPGIPGGSELILFVDDEPMLTEMGEEMLQTKGYNVSSMHDSREALELFSANAESIDLIITDQTMPNMTGVELIREVKKIKPGIPVILCTGYSSKVNEDNASECGIDAYLPKPLEPALLFQTVRRLLDEGCERGDT